MASRQAYVTVSLNKKGRVISVKQGRRKIRKRQGEKGPTKRGGSTKSCEEIVSVLVHELITCRKDSDKKEGEEGRKQEKYPGGDPCCYRDSETGEEWCWC